MYRKLLEIIIKNRTWVVFAAALTAAAGIYSAFLLPIDAIPDITNVQVQVTTRTGALDPEQAEKTVTYYVETELAGLPGVVDTRSITKYGLSQVVIIFADGTDIYRARQLVMERLQALGDLLPRGMSPQLGPISTGLGEVLIYTLDAKPGSRLAAKDERSRLIYLRTIQDFILRPYLKSSLQNVADIDSTGGYKKEIHIDVMPPYLERHGMTIADLTNKLSSLGENYGGGYIDRGGKQIIVRTDGIIDAISSISAIPVKLNARGVPVRIGDVARVREDYPQRLGAATEGGRETVMGTVLMLLGANSREVARDAEIALRSAPLPDDVTVKIGYSRGFLVNATIKTVAENLATGAALVVVVLLLILGNFRAAILVSLAIPISMLAAAVGMKLFGISANLMSLGAVDFGLLVDGSVVLIENYLRRREVFSKSGATPTAAAKLSLLIDSCAEVVKPVAFGLAIIMIVYVPILTLDGIEGKMFKPMALTVLMALGASLIVALALMPVMAYYSARKTTHAESDPILFRAIRRLYYPALKFGQQRLGVLVAVSIVIMVTAGAVFYRTGSDFVPPLDEGDMIINFVRDYDISLEKAIAMQKRSEKIIMSFTEVDQVLARIGTAETASDVMGVNLADTFVVLKKSGKGSGTGGRRLSKKELFASIESAIKKEMPDQEIIQSQPIAMRFNEILEGSRADVTLRIYGKDLGVLTTLIDNAQKILSKVTGGEAETDPITALKKSPILNIRLDYVAMNRYGVTLADVNNTLQTAMAGTHVGSYYEYDWRFPIVLRMEEGFRKDTGAIKNLPVPLAEGGFIPLHKVASISEVVSVANIARHRSRRYSAVSIQLEGRDVSGYVAEARLKIERELKLPQGYHLQWSGQFQNLEQARARLLIIVPIVLFVIFVLVLRSVGSVKQALLVYSSIPFAVSGGVFALAIRGLNFSVSAAVGFIAVLGIAILNGLVMVTFINQLREKGESVGVAVFNGAHKRLRPVVMTALVASLGFLPMALNTGMGAEVQRPLATVVIGGLITATALTLVLLPSLYLWMEKEKQ